MVEPRPWFVNFNDEARHIMNVTGVSSTANMGATSTGWTGLDGTGVIVTVADTGLDNGVNNSNMHPDFADHIVDVVSFRPLRHLFLLQPLDLQRRCSGRVVRSRNARGRLGAW